MDSRTTAPGGGAERGSAPQQQQQAQAPQPRQPGAPVASWAAFGTGGGAAIVFRDLASI